MRSGPTQEVRLPLVLQVKSCPGPLQIVWLPLVVQVNGGCPGSLQYVRLPLVVQVRVSGSVDPGCSCAVTGSVGRR